VGVRILVDWADDTACLYDSVTDTAFGRVFHGHGAYEKQEAFLTDCNKAGLDPRSLDNPGDMQDQWVASLDKGCCKCIAEPWEACDEYAAPHERIGR
jgi:hypothetical protein